MQKRTEMTEMRAHWRWRYALTARSLSSGQMCSMAGSGVEDGDAAAYGDDFDAQRLEEDLENQVDDNRDGNDLLSAEADDGELEEEPLFSCRLDTAKVLTATLTCLGTGTKKDQLAQVEVNEEGMVFIVTGKAKFTQSQATINSGLFQAYQCQPGGGRFTVDLPLLLECLQIFGTSNLANTTLTMSYESPRAVLRLTLEEQGVLTTCEINAIEEGEDAMDLAALATAFRGSPEVFRAILKSELLKEAISEFSDLPGAVSLRVHVSPDEPHFQLYAGGNHGSLEIYFPRTSEAFVYFDCKEERTWSYILGALSQGMRALNVAKETYVRINEDGIMCVQHQVGDFGGQSTYVDFLMMCDEEDVGGWQQEQEQADEGQDEAATTQPEAGMDEEPA